MQQKLTLAAGVDLANELRRERKWAALEKLLRPIVAAIGVSGRLEPATLAYRLRERLVEALYRQGKEEEAVDAFEEMLRLTGTTFSASFDRVYLQALRETRSIPVPLSRMYRLHHLTELLERTAGLDGETAECGCFRGLSSFVLCATIRTSEPNFDGSGHHVFDSFAGLSAPGAEDQVTSDDDEAKRIAEMCQEGWFRACLEEVQYHLGAFPAIAYHPGWIPASLAGIAERRYRFVHVDLDLYAPTAGAFNYFYPRLVPGGIIVSDDYAWPGARRAVDEFAAGHGVKVDVSDRHQAWVQRAP